MTAQIYVLCSSCGGRICPEVEEYDEIEQGGWIIFRHRGACARKAPRLDNRALAGFPPELGVGG